MSAVQTVAVKEDEAELRLDRWFHRRFPQISHGRLEKLLRTGQLRVDGKRAKAGQRLEAGQQIRVPPLPDDTAPVFERPAVTDADARMLRDAVLHMDDDVIVINKPPGLPVQGGTGVTRHLDGMLDALQFDMPERPKLVHRLDKDTSGVLLLGRTARSTAQLTAAFRTRAARKCYWALVVGVPKVPMGRIDAPLAKQAGESTRERMQVDEDDGRHAITWYRIVASAFKKAAWLEMEPRTGRTHQLRAHAALLGTPIQGDSLYGGDVEMLSGGGISRKLHLHARAIKLPHPRKGVLEVEAPLPTHMVSSFEFFGFEPDAAGPAFAAFDEE
jgi:23S rRNA pseudouridine955/2504/2580 synthase